MPPTTTQKSVDIDKLSPEAKAELFAQLQAEQQAEAEATVGRRNEAMKSLMSDRDHLRDCPTGRAEMYGATKPAEPRKGIGPREVTVVRCQECGGTTVLDQPYDESVVALEAMISETEEVEEQ